MSRFHPQWNIEPILSAASRWKEVALLGGGSVFTNKKIWTNEGINELERFYVENLDEGEGNFISKLEGQIQPASKETKQLMAELTWVMLLCPSNIGPDNKRENITTIWSWSNEPFPHDSPLLADEVLQGIGSSGTAYNTQRWREVVYFVVFLKDFRALDEEIQNQLLADGWQFAEWMQELRDTDNRQLRHMLLYLLFPDNFDRIFGKSDRRKLLSAFTNLPRRKIYEMTALEMSREIQSIRKHEEEVHGSNELDFYESPLIERWAEQRIPRPKAPSKQSEFDLWTESLTSQHVLAALEEIENDGFPPDARSSTYDLIHKSNRYPPKYVLSLAVKHATGEEFPRSNFGGGEESKAFRVLRNLGFSIERKDLIPELLKKFLAQADEGSNLAVSDYPDKYRDLDINVSFGKGNFAKIPWISYTGFGQKTSEGIYPVILYFKSEAVLIVAFGVSETSKPTVEWEALGDKPTVEDYLASNHGATAKHYGKSLVRAGYSLAEDVDFDAIEKSLDEVISQFQEQFADQPADPSPPSTVFTIEDALRDLFIQEEKFTEILELLESKKNLILQGPPGVGKTFACKRVAYALMGQKSNDQLGMVQFHQSYSYEDFIQGYRPSGTGFRLKNGIFYEFCAAARDDPGNTYVFIIDELNRGNLSKVFGELMLLIETDKRGPEWAIPLAYSEEDSPKFYIPENLYLIGLMNTADRSLAMVDYALRRRFAFSTLTPGFETEQFFDYLAERGATPAFIGELVERMTSLNRKIAEDTTNLGPGFCIGHSFFCAIPSGVTPDGAWYERVIRFEIAPLLKEYYFDAAHEADALVEGLLRAP